MPNLWNLWSLLSSSLSSLLPSQSARLICRFEARIALLKELTFRGFWSLARSQSACLLQARIVFMGFLRLTTCLSASLESSLEARIAFVQKWTCRRTPRPAIFLVIVNLGMGGGFPALLSLARFLRIGLSLDGNDFRLSLGWCGLGGTGFDDRQRDFLG